MILRFHKAFHYEVSQGFTGIQKVRCTFKVHVLLIETFFDDLMVVVFFFGLITPYFAIDIIIMILNINKSVITFMVFRTF